MKTKITTRRIVTNSLLIALSIILSILDGMIPSFIPGMKLGLANIIILMILYSYGIYDALIVNIFRVFLASLLRGNIFTMGFFMSLSGALISLLVMYLLKRFITKLHIVGVSVIGSIFHSIAQIMVGLIFLNTPGLLYYLPILCLTSTITGIFIGFSALYLNKLNLLR